MKLQKMLSLILALICAINFAVPASASEITSHTETAEAYVITNPIEFENGDILNGNSRSLSKPKEYWNLLEDGEYSATLTQVGSSKLYTNFYFKSNANGIMHVTFDIKAEGGAKFRVGIYNITDSYDATSVDFDVDTTGLASGVIFSNMDPNDNYAVYFQSVYNGYNVVYITGSALVYA